MTNRPRWRECQSPVQGPCRVTVAGRPEFTADLPLILSAAALANFDVRLGESVLCKLISQLKADPWQGFFRRGIRSLPMPSADQRR